MRAQGRHRAPQRFVRTTDSRHDSPVFPNLQRDVAPVAAERGWIADFARIRIASGFCYLAAIPDACSRKVVSCNSPIKAMLSAASARE